MDFQQILLNDAQEIECYLKTFINSNTEYKNQIIEPMNYTLLSGGKRLRPVLFIETLKAFKKDYKPYMNIACCIEAIHSYSLIHDDLPEMDNDDYRRGKLTNHKVYGDAIAVLSGDALLNYAMEKSLECLKENFKIEVLNAIEYIFNSSGINGMIIGQVIDMNTENKNISPDELKFIHINKTAKLMSTGIISAAIIANADKDQLKYLRKYAYNIGLSFQIVDDILSHESENEVGKSNNKDEVKNTYPKYFGIEKTREIANGLLDEAKEILGKIDNFDKSFFMSLTDYLKNRSK